MRRIVLVVCFVLGFAAVMAAQSKIESKWHCPKATDTQKYDVGDMADHAYAIAKGMCTASTPDANLAEKTGAFTEFQETKKTSLNSHGRFIATASNGDKMFYSYSVAMTDPKKPVSNKWTIDNGTGKYKGMKGSGTCTGKMNEDGSIDWDCTGTYTMASK